METTRRWFRWAAGWLLIAAGGHAYGHWKFYLASSTFDAKRRVVIDAMQTYVVFPPTGATLWTVLQMFSFAFFLLLALFGTQCWILARECEPLALQRHALRNLVLCLFGVAALAILHPVPQALAIFGIAAVLFAGAAGRRQR